MRELSCKTGEGFPNPRLELAEEAVELGKREGVDFILPSVADLSWILLRLCIRLNNDVSLEDLYLHKVSVSKAIYWCHFYYRRNWL